MTERELLEILTGTPSPRFVTDREKVIVRKCLSIINDRDATIANLSLQTETLQDRLVYLQRQAITEEY